jgi:hypothetical protein
VSWRFRVSIGYRVEEGLPDDFRDERDDRVAELLEAVHPSGNIISHSTHRGFSEPPAAV